jgi:solute carrier family 39 (zinc transporter), member 1/2/3
MGIIEMKVGPSLLIFTSGLIGGFLPLRFDESERSSRLLAVGNGFAGGIFLGAGLLHMLGDAQRNFSTFVVDYPVAMLIAGGGFLGVLFLEMVALRGREDVGAMPGAERSVYPFLLIVVLSVHSLIAGIALGLEGDMFASLALLVAILAHKGSAAFALGLSLKTAHFERPRMTALVTLFSCMTPTGVLVGVVFSRMLEGSGAVLAEAIFDAVAAGTFVYVAVLDIINEAFAEKVDLGVKFAVLTAGFLGMALLAVWT